MDMKDAAERLGKIIAKLSGSTNPNDERELRELHGAMLGGAGAADQAKKAKGRKAAPKAVKPLKGETVAKAKRGTKKGAGK